jgi:phospholipid/cholesterol/gamma-HCH transport system substrate-binding protein
MGDYTNLSIQLDLDLTKPFLPGVPCTTLDNLPGGLSLDQLEQLIDSGQLCEGASNALTLCINNPSLANCQDLPAGVVNAVCDSSPVSLPLLCGGGGAGGGDGGGVDLPDLPGLGGLDGPLGDLGLGGVLGRPAFEAGASTTALPSTGSTSVPTADDYDPGLVSLLVTPVVAQP